MIFLDPLELTSFSLSFLQIGTWENEKKEEEEEEEEQEEEE